MRISRYVTFLAAILSLWLGGCAVGQKISYQDAKPELRPADTIALGLATVDQRSKVAKPDFVGVFRGGFGNPFPVGTASGNPLSAEMSQALAASLSAKGYNVTTLQTERLEEEKAILARLAATKARRLVLLTLRDWWSDTLVGTLLNYDITLGVFNGDGTPLAHKTMQGKQDLGRSAMNPYGYAKTAVPQGFAKMMQELFSDAEIEKALH
jgi:hypothetical protein